MEAVRMWVGHLVRRSWRATIFLALLAGLAGGVAMAGWSAGRRTATAFDRFLRYAAPPELIVTFCPPDIVEIDGTTLARCFSYDAREETAVLNGLPEVETAARASFRGLTAARPAEPDRMWPAGSTIFRDEGIPTLEGEQILVAGRWFSPRAVDEVVVNERFRERSGVAIGEELVLTFWAPDELGRVPDDRERLHGPSARVRVVGVVRGLLDLAASTTSVGRLMDESKVIGGPALAAATADAGGYGGVAVRARPGDHNGAGAAIERAFPGRQINIATIGDGDADEIEPIREAIRYEAGGAVAFAALAALAAAVFMGQAVARQSRREWADLATLRALGMANRDMRRAAGLRGAMIGVAAALGAAVTAIVLSPLGPIGVGRRAEVDPGPSLDGTVLATGTLGVLAVVTLAAWLPVRRHGGRTPGTSSSANRRFGAPRPLPATAIAGLGLTVGSRPDGRRLPIGTALAGVALAVATIVAAACLTASLDTLTGTPERFGAAWDASVADVGAGISGPSDAPGGPLPLEELLGGDPAVVAAAGIVGTDIEIGGEVVWVQAFRPVGAVDGIRPVITAGREPVAVDEIALGSITMDDLGVGIGDTVDVVGTVTGQRPTGMTVVGTTIVNDTYETSPGRGAVVTLEWIDTNSPGLTPDPYVVRLEPNADVRAFSTAVEERSSAVVSLPVRQGAIRNVERIATLPFLLAALVGVLAVASLAHALTLSIRRSHGQLAVWKSIGFTRLQVRAAVAWYATALAVGAAVVGVPLGVVLGRLGWQLVADQIGVASGPEIPLSGIAAAVLGVVVVANVIAVYPAWRAARLPTAEALRVE